MKPTRSLSQRMTVFSICEPAGPWLHAAMFWLIVEAIASAKTLMTVGVGLKRPK